MSVSNQEKPIITMDAVSDQLTGNPFVDYLVYTTDNTGAAGNICVVQDKDNAPVARFPVDGPNYTGMRYINRRIPGLKISQKTGTGGVLHVHLRR